MKIPKSKVVKLPGNKTAPAAPVEKPLSKRDAIKLERLTARYMAAVNRIGADFYIRPVYIRPLLKGMVADHDRLNVTPLHNAIATRGREHYLFALMCKKEGRDF